ncbi:hypothetical protein [Paludisphaera mucosa]|uniref:Secreted protein n=1 Tax=Paludisphaera mucosa TaxID=3030827 RepID=A0ABT6FLH4_9BACT|nr:hypothetical protein [Paludisphaera mucosa]MDG3008369.1 hypothetical protein [Paludisphaera mucosa]
MRASAGIPRLLMTLLVLRVVACPIAASHSAAGSEARFIIRVCVWPAPRAGRPALVLQRRVDPAEPLGSTRRKVSAGRREGGAIAVSAYRSDLLALLSRTGLAPVHVPDRPRC